jgi:hypothetical protein
VKSFVLWSIPPRRQRENRAFAGRKCGKSIAPERKFRAPPGPQKAAGRNADERACCCGSLGRPTNQRQAKVGTADADCDQLRASPPSERRQIRQETSIAIARDTPGPALLAVHFRSLKFPDTSN